MELTSSKAEGLTFKGGSITNFNKAFTKTLRKPEEVIKEIQGATKAKALKTFANISTKGYNYTGLGNNDTIILKVYS